MFAMIASYFLSRTVVPECFEDFGDLVVPILQERGVFKTAHGEGTLRQRLSGRDRLPASHPAQAHRAPAAG